MSPHLRLRRAGFQKGLPGAVVETPPPREVIVEAIWEINPNLQLTNPFLGARRGDPLGIQKRIAPLGIRIDFPQTR